MEVMAKAKNRRTIISKLRDGGYAILFVRLIDKSEDWSGYENTAFKEVRRSKNGTPRILMTRIKLLEESFDMLFAAKIRLDNEIMEKALREVNQPQQEPSK